MATSKRAGGNASESETKRAKLALAPYEIVVGGAIYVNVDQLFQSAEFKDFFAKRFIADEDLHVVFVTKMNAASGDLRVKKIYGSKTDVRLVKKDAHVERIIAIAKENPHPLAPPVLNDKDLPFFVDKADVRHQAEMRGKRTMDGIYFKAKDAATVFENPCLVDTILDGRTSYREAIDYVWFALPKTRQSNVK